MEESFIRNYYCLINSKYGFRLKKGINRYFSSSSFIDEDENFQKGIEILKNWGLEINENNSLSKKFGYFAGDDLTRFEELEKAQNISNHFAKGGGVQQDF